MFTNSNFPAASQQAIVDALIGRLSSDDDLIRRTAKDTLVTAGRGDDETRRLVTSRLKKAQDAQTVQVEISENIQRELAGP